MGDYSEGIVMFKMKWNQIVDIFQIQNDFAILIISQIIILLSSIKPILVEPLFTTAEVFTLSS